MSCAFSSQPCFICGWHRYLSGSDDFRDVEVINLDGLPEAEALRLLGVDEKGNDLRGKMGSAK